MRRTKRSGWPYGQPPNVQFEINRASPQSVGLVAWWPSIASRGANTLREFITGTYPGPLDTGLLWESAALGWSPRFVTNNHITVTNGAALDGWSHCTIAVRCKLIPGSSAAYPGIIGKNLCFLLAYQETNSTIWYRMYGTGGDTGFGTYTGNHWGDHLFVLTYDSADTILYIDGKYAETDPDATGPVVDNGNALYFGCREYDDDEMEGHIYDVRMYDRALTAADVYELYAEPWELYKPLIRRWTGWKSPVTVRIPRYGFTNFQVPGIV